MPLIQAKLQGPIAVIGAPYWCEVAAGLFARAGMNAEIPSFQGRAAFLRWVLTGRWRRYGAIHHVGGPNSARSSLAMSLVPRPLIFHWIGSDLVNYRASNGWLNRRIAEKAAVHLADSPQLSEELRAIGLESEVVRLLPTTIEAEVSPLPAEFTVLSYWSDGRRQFYGGEIVLRLAEAFPDVRFRIAGAEGVGQSAPPNVEYLGFQKSMNSIYLASSVLVRMPEHDSLSAMVLEMLARGRFVIYNQPLANCRLARDFEAARQALEELRRMDRPNIEGAQMVRTRFSLDTEAAHLRSAYDSIFAGADLGRSR